MGEIEGPRVELFDDAHRDDARLGVPREERRLHGGGAAVPRQERGVDVDEAETRHGEDFVREDPSVGDHDACVRRGGAQLTEKPGVAADAPRLRDR
jgi:hypothetical protein